MTVGLPTVKEPLGGSNEKRDPLKEGLFIFNLDFNGIDPIKSPSFPGCHFCRIKTAGPLNGLQQ